MTTPEPGGEEMLLAITRLERAVVSAGLRRAGGSFNARLADTFDVADRDNTLGLYIGLTRYLHPLLLAEGVFARPGAPFGVDEETLSRVRQGFPF